MTETISITSLYGPLEEVEQFMANTGQTSGFDDTYPDVEPRSHGQLIALGERVREITTTDGLERAVARIQAIEEGF